MKPELEVELRATVANLRIRASRHELLLLALLPELGEHQKRVLLRLSEMEHAEVSGAPFADQSQAETETMRWIRSMREALLS